MRISDWSSDVCSSDLVPFANRLYQLLAAPLLAKMPVGGQLVAIDVASPFFAPIKLAFFVALIVSMPVLLYQAWAFVAPGLYKQIGRASCRERVCQYV